VPRTDHLTRHLTLALDEFAHASLVSRANLDRVPVDSVVQHAALYYARDLSSGRPASRSPRFRREARAGKGRLEVQLELGEPTWQVLDREAERQAISAEALIEHACLYYLADLDSGRIAERILHEGDE
jgi:hypothetical protein